MIILIPAYEPDGRLPRLVDEIVSTVPRVDVVVVDDGSGIAHLPIFQAAQRAGATVLGYQGNRGKGHALKYGLRYIAEASPGEDVVCADGDGQHTVDDIVRVGTRAAETGATVLGVRLLTGEVPWRSKIGNAMSRRLIGLVTRRQLSDTQTGLRAYPAHLVHWLQGVPGERYEYETNLLLAAARANQPMVELEIATIYLDGNASSHFRPIVDSARVYAPLLAFGAVSVASFAVDLVLLLTLQQMTGDLLASVIIARAASSTMNFFANRRLVFADATRPLLAAAARYWTLAGVLLSANYALLLVLTSAGVALGTAKLLTEAALLVASYLVQRHVVFSREQSGRVTQVHRQHPADSLVDRTYAAHSGS